MIAFEDFRSEARAFCVRVCGGSSGVRVNDPVYRETTERRDPGPKYSSCGDLPHAMIEHLLGDDAARVPWLNRASLGQYRDGMNVGLLTVRPIGGGAGGLARAPKGGELFECGDVIVSWSRPDTRDAHVCVVDSHSAESKTLASWDYGQGSMSPEQWRRFPNQLEGRARVRGFVFARVERSGMCCFNDGKIVRSVLPLRAIYDLACSLESSRKVIP